MFKSDVPEGTPIHNRDHPITPWSLVFTGIYALGLYAIILGTVAMIFWVIDKKVSEWHMGRIISRWWLG